MSSKQLIVYEHIHYKVKFSYNYFIDDINVDNIIDIKREVCKCIGSDQYIQGFIREMKDRVIRHLPNLCRMRILLGIFDKNDFWHRFIVSTVKMVYSILNINRKINYYKSIFVVIEYEGKVVFTGNLNFENIE